MKFVVKEWKDKKYLYLEELEKNESTEYLQNYFKRQIGYFQRPNKEWDGYINYFIGGRWLPFGFWKELYEYGKSNSLEIKVEGIKEHLDLNLDRKEFIDFCYDLFKDHPEDIIPRTYQLETAFTMLKWKRGCVEIGTGGGKSLLLYIISSWLKKNNPNIRIILMVPSVDLVEQMYRDFMSYDHKNYNKFTYSLLYSNSKNKQAKPDITITTYNSAKLIPEEELKNYDTILLDEAHNVARKDVRTVIDKAIKKEYCLGVTGTLPNVDEATYLTLFQYTGPLVDRITVNQLLKMGYVVSCNVKIIVLDWAKEEEKKRLYDTWYESGKENKMTTLLEEKKLIRESKKRLDKIVEIISKFDNCRLVLFQDIKTKYGKTIYEILKEKNPFSSVYYIDGSIKTSEREKIKEEMRKGGNKILVATYKTLGEGISIKPINIIFFTESYKSEKLIRQSIGRGLRLHKDKKTVDIIDFVDNFNYSPKKWVCYQYQQSLKRIKTYENQEFKYKKFDLKF